MGRRIDGEKLRELRENLTLTQEDLAAETAKRASVEDKPGISAKTIQRIENGGGAQLYTIERLADALGVEPEELFVSEGSSDNPLSQYLCDFEDFIKDRTRDFTGRTFVFDAINKFIEDNECGYFFVRGDPGIGKSAIASSLVKRWDCIHHFNRRAEGINRTETFIKNVSAQLISGYELGHRTLPADCSMDGRFLSGLLKEVSERLENGDRCIIVVDALDEVDTGGTDSGGNLLYLPSKLPEGIFIVATARRQPLALRIDSVTGELCLESDSVENLTDVEEYLWKSVSLDDIAAYITRRELDDAAFVSMMKDKSEGNFMYLRYVLPEIGSGAYRDTDESRIPKGLQNYYEDHWKLMGMMRCPLPGRELKIVYILSEAVKPVSRKVLAKFSKENEAIVQSVLDDWTQFLHKQQADAGIRYSVYHNSFREFLNRKDIIQAAGIDIKDIVKHISDEIISWIDDD